MQVVLVGQLVLQVLRERLAPLDPQGQREERGQMVFKEVLDLRVQQEPRVWLDCLDRLGLREAQEILDCLVQQEQQARLVLVELVDPPEPLAQQGVLG